MDSESNTTLLRHNIKKESKYYCLVIIFRLGTKGELRFFFYEKNTLDPKIIQEKLTLNHHMSLLTNNYFVILKRG